MRIFIASFLLLFLPAASVRAEWIQLPWQQLGANLPIWKPDDFDAAKRYPAIVFYHGTGGQPNASLLHEMTGGKDFVLVGMAFLHSGRSETNAQEAADEMGLLDALKTTLVKSLSVDSNRIYVGGFSKGGWHTAMLLDCDRTLAGGLILGGGISEKRPDTPKYDRPVPIYIGCGRNDANYPPSLGALVYFRKLGADVTLEAWPNVGHSNPESPPESMRQWLRVQAAGNELKSEASEWIEKRLLEIESLDDPVDQWFAYEEFTDLPFVKRFGSEAVKRAKGKSDDLSKNPDVANEKKWRDESRRILASESGDRLLTTLQEASRAHEKLAEKAAGTRAGADAQKDLERTRELLKSAKVVTRRSKIKPEPIVPETNPTAPSGNPERGSFFPPGTNVKPAN